MVISYQRTVLVHVTWRLPCQTPLHLLIIIIIIIIIITIIITIIIIIIIIIIAFCFILSLCENYNSFPDMYLTSEDFIFFTLWWATLVGA